jgi:hypothetical protein
MLEKIVTDTIFETLREKLVDAAYLPEVTDIPNLESSDPDLAKVAIATYQTRLDAVVNQKGFCIDLKPYGSNHDKGEKKVPRIVIDVHQFLPGTLGNDTIPNYELHESGTYYVRTKSFSLLSNLTFCVYAVGNTAEHMQTMNHLIMQALPYRGYMKPTTEEDLLPSNNFFTILRDKGHTPELPEGILERYYIYEIPDLEEVERIYLPGTIARISEITLNLENQDLIIETE